MTNIKNSQSIHIQGENISVKNISNVVTTLSESKELSKLFASVLEAISSEKVITELKLLEAEILKGDQASEATIRKRLDTIWKIAPDIWEVITDTATHPLKGMSTVVLKILRKVREEKLSKLG